MRYVLVGLLISFFIGSTLAQEIVRFGTSDGLLQVDFPVDWEIIEDIPGAFIFSSPSFGYGRISVYNIAMICGYETPGPDPLWFSCDPDPVDILPFVSHELWSQTITGDEDIAAEGTSECRLAEHYLGCARDLGNGDFAVLYWEAYGTEISEMLPRVFSVIESVIYSSPLAVSPDQYPIPIITDDGWTLELGSLDLDPESALYIGPDGYAYVVGQGRMLIVSPDGQVQNIIGNEYLEGFSRDFGVLSNGELWVLSPWGNIDKFDTQGNHLGEFIYDEGGIWTAVQMEVLTDDTIILLAQIYEEAQISVFAPDGSNSTMFRVDAPSEFDFFDDPAFSPLILGAASVDEFYVFNWNYGTIRVFDGDGNVSVSNLLVDLSGTPRQMSFAASGEMEIYAEDRLQRVDLINNEVEVINLPHETALLLPDNGLIYLDRSKKLLVRTDLLDTK